MTDSCVFVSSFNTLFAFLTTSFAASMADFVSFVSGSCANLASTADKFFCNSSTFTATLFSVLALSTLFSVFVFSTLPSLLTFSPGFTVVGLVCCTVAEVPSSAA